MSVLTLRSVEKRTNLHKIINGGNLKTLDLTAAAISFLIGMFKRVCGITFFLIDTIVYQQSEYRSSSCSVDGETMRQNLGPI